MTTTDLLKTFLKDELVIEKYGITPEKSELMKLNEETSIFFVKVLKRCLSEYENQNARASTNLKTYIEINITEQDVPKYSKKEQEEELEIA